MNKPKLTYFDAPVSRGEECRLALHLAGIDFEDARINAAAWREMKEQTPYGGLPVLELPGQPPLAHSNAILVLIGRRYGLHPTDDFEAARHEGMMQHVEDLRAAVTPTIRMGDAEKRAAREAFVAGFLPAWARFGGKEHSRASRSSAVRSCTSWTSNFTWRCAGSSAARSTTFLRRYLPTIPSSRRFMTPCANIPA